MNTLTAVRQEMADQLNEAGITAYDFVAGRINPPCVVIEPGDPYLEKDLDATFTDHRVRFALAIIGPRADNAVTTEGLDELISRTILALDNWDLERVGQPGELSTNNAQYLAASAVFSASIEIKEVI